MLVYDLGRQAFAGYWSKAGTCFLQRICPLHVKDFNYFKISKNKLESWKCWKSHGNFSNLGICGIHFTNVCNHPRPPSSKENEGQTSSCPCHRPTQKIRVQGVAENLESQRWLSKRGSICSTGIFLRTWKFIWFFQCVEPLGYSGWWTWENRISDGTEAKRIPGHVGTNQLKKTSLNSPSEFRWLIKTNHFHQFPPSRTFFIVFPTPNTTEQLHCSFTATFCAQVIPRLRWSLRANLCCQAIVVYLNSISSALSIFCYIFLNNLTNVKRDQKGMYFSQLYS